MKNLITDVAGLRVGHAEDAGLMSGVTVVLCDRPNVAVGRVTGGAPGTRGLSILAPDSVNDGVDAIVFSGGSAFGLDAAGGVMAELRQSGVGFEIGGTRVPIVAQAILFDLLDGGAATWPADTPVYWHLGRAAAQAASAGSDDVVHLGSVGAGLGATTADAKGGLGMASQWVFGGYKVAAMVAVNAIGSALIGGGPHFWAAADERCAEFGGHGWPTPFPIAARSLTTKGGRTTATTLALVATDAPLAKPELARVLAMADDGLARALRPVHAPLDGDTLFAVSVAEPEDQKSAPEMVMVIGAAAAACVARSVARAVYAATRPPGDYRGPPAYCDRHP